MAKILVVDDEKEIASLLAARLKKKGFDVTALFNGKDAVAQAAQMRPDLIIMDIMMPGMAGPEAAALLKKNKETAGIPVIFLSALLSKDEETPKGENVIFSKPYDIETLIQKINELI